MTEPTPAVSLVVPLHDAAGRVSALHRALVAERHRLPTFELLLVDDASEDETWPLIRELAKVDPVVIGLRLAENVGQTGALAAGFATARGDVVVMMDDDLDTRPAEILRFIDAVCEGADFASGWRQGTREPLRHIGSRLYNRRLLGWGLPFHDAGCGTNAMTSDIAHRLAAAGWGIRQHRFKPAVSQLTRNIVEIPFPVRPTSGSHHNVRTLAASWLDVEFTFGPLTPLRFVVLAVAAPAVVSYRLSCRASSVRRWRTAAALGALASGALSVAAADVLALRLRADRRDAARPPFTIAEVVGGSPRVEPPHDQGR